MKRLFAVLMAVLFLGTTSLVLADQAAAPAPKAAAKADKKMVKKAKKNAKKTAAAKAPK